MEMIRYEKHRELLRVMLRNHSVKRGEFVLASGEKSTVYVDVRLTALRAEATPLIGRIFIEKMHDRGWMPDAVGGLTMGADPIVTAISRESLEYGLSIDGFLVRKEAKRHGRQQYIEGLPDTGVRRVIIVEDVCTTGGSALTAVKHARSAKLEVLGVIALVDREQGGGAAIDAMGCPFERIFTMSELLEES
jgi:orotate phosphoribosyltransferase